VNATVLASPIVEMAEIRFIDEADVDPPLTEAESVPDTVESITGVVSTDWDLPGAGVGEDAADVIREGVDDAKYFLWYYSSPMELVTTMTPVIADPSVNTGHKITIRFYISGTGPGAWVGGSLKVGLYITGAIVSEIDVPQGVWAHNTWVEYEASIPEADVIAWRAAGGYADPMVAVEKVTGAPDLFLVGISKLTLTIPVV
jgi:hypothetical protein